LSEMTHTNGPEPVTPRTGEEKRAVRLPLQRAADRRQQHRWVPAVAGWLAFLLGLADIIEVFLPGLAERYRIHKIAATGTLSNLTKTTDVIIGLLLLMLSHGLRRRKRRAWEGVMVLLAASLIIHVTLAVARHTADLHTPGFVAFGLLLVLGFYRHEFYAMSDPRSRWHALATLCALVVADIVIGVVYLYVPYVTRGLRADYSLIQRVHSTVVSLAGFSGPVRFISETRSDIFAFITGGLGLLTLALALYLFLRPTKRVSRLTSSDASKIRCMLDKHGEQDSLGYFALRSDKSIIWSPTGKSCIGYRVLQGVMLASGDPIGDPEAWPGAIHAFLDEAARYAWVPAVIGCGELGAEVWCREGGLTALELGDEAIVGVADFTLQGGAMKNVRQMVNRVQKKGYIAEIRRIADVPAEEIADLVRQADSWRGSPTERGFSMALGRVGGPADGQCVIATAKLDGKLHALLHFVPWGEDGLSLDLMRRDRSAAPGLNDFMIVEAIKCAASLDVKRLSLNFAVFRAALERGERIGAGPVLRAWRGILLFLSRWFQIESLYKFNAKFSPEWVPRFMVFPGPSDALRIGLASLEAEAFLVWPTPELRRIVRKAGLVGRRPVAAVEAHHPVGPRGPVD
jgi:lysyl-tRNA synthetase, class II